MEKELGFTGCVRTGKKTADLSTALRSGRDDKFVERWTGVHPLDNWQFPCNKFVISTGAYPDFLPVAFTTSTYAAFSQRKPHESYQRHQVQQEIWGSGVERSAVSFPVLTPLA
jgi:hypothetical protein